MSNFSCLVNHNMCFPHNGRIIIVDELKYYDPKSQTSPQSNISSMADNKFVSSFTNVSPGVYKDSTLVCVYCGSLPTPYEPSSSIACFKHHRKPANGPKCIHNIPHLHNLLFLTHPNHPILLLKGNFLLLVYLLIYFHPELFS